MVEKKTIDCLTVGTKQLELEKSMGKVEGRQVAQHQNRQRIEEGQKKHIVIVGVDFFLVLQLIQCNT